MANDLTLLFKTVLVADTETDITGGGIPADSAGTGYLIVNNLSGAEVAVAGIWQKDGATPADVDNIYTAFTIEAGGWWRDTRIKLGAGDRIFIEADAPVTVRLSARKEG